MKTIILKDAIGTLLQTRRSIRILGESIDTECTLDFTDVEFMSRACTDELCCLMDEKNNIHVVNMCPTVATMFDIVKDSRRTPRELLSSNSEVLTFDDMDSLRAYLRKI